MTIAELIGAIAQALERMHAEQPDSHAAALATPTPTPTTNTDHRPGHRIAAHRAPELRAWLQAGTYLDWHAESAPHPGTGPHFGVVRVFLNDALFASLSGTGLSTRPAPRP